MHTKNKIEFNKLQIGLSAGSHFVIDIYQSFYIGLIPVLTFKFGLSLFEVSLLGATSVIANSLFSPIFGYMADRYGLKYFIAIGPLVTSVFLSFLGVIPNYWIIILFLFLGNLGISSFHPASAAMAGHYGGRRKGLSTSLINFGGNFGSAFGSLVVILILKKIGMNYTPLAMILGIATSLILLKYLPSQRSVNPSTKSLDFFIKLKRVNRKKLYLIGILIFTVYSLYVVWISLSNYMPLYFTDLKIPLIDIGIILFLFGTIGGGSGLIFCSFYDRFKNGNFIIQIGLIVSIPLLFFIFQTKEIVSVILFVLSGFFFISVQPVCIRMSQDLLPGNMSLASSLILGLSSGLAGVTMIFLGKIADIIGIAKLIRFELLLLALAILLMFAYPIIEKKSGKFS
ncbi:MAG: MFS transporter [Actinobacteria bacterium]|nr:MFS transporter [Actinomycetota bacterium]